MLKWGQSRCEEAQGEPVRRGRTVQTKSTWNYVWILLVSAADVTLMKFWRHLLESQNPHRCKNAKCSSGLQIRKVIFGDSHQHENVTQSQERQSPAKKCVTPECADARRVSERYASTPCRLMSKRMMSKCRSRQPESYNTLSAFLHDWLERGVWAELPTDLRLNDGQCWQPVKALPLPSPGASV